MKNSILLLIVVLLFSCTQDKEFIKTKNDKVNPSYGSGSTILSREESCQYSGPYTGQNADYIIRNVSQLVDRINSLNNDSNGDGKTIYLINNAQFDLSNVELPIVIKKSINIVSGRTIDFDNPKNSSDGARIYGSKAGDTFFKVEADNVIFSGLKIEGHDTVVGTVTYDPIVTTGILINGYNNLIVENCEISGWSYRAIGVENSTNNKIIYNHIHNNRRYGLGYGVLLHNNDNYEETEVSISCNYFERNRHDIAGSGRENQTYTASYNDVDGPGDNSLIWTQRFDMHGKDNDTGEIAGKRVVIHNNNFLSDTDKAILIGGIPTDGAYIQNNNFSHKCEKYALQQRKYSKIVNKLNWENMNVSYNSYDTSIESLEIVNDDFLFIDANRSVQKYTYGNDCDCFLSKVKVNHGYFSYREFLSGNWVDNGTDDLIALTNDNYLAEMRLYPFTGTFYNGQGGVVVGNGFNSNHYKKFYVGNFKIQSGFDSDDLIVLTSDNKLKLFPFTGTFYNGQGGQVLTESLNSFKEFLVGNWTGNGTDDIIGVTNDGELRLFKLEEDGTYLGSVGGIEVGHGFDNVEKFIVGNWTGNGTSDLIVLRDDSSEGVNTQSLFLYPFNGATFYGQNGGTRVGYGYANYKDFIVYNHSSNQTDDLIGIFRDSNEIMLIRFNENGVVYKQDYIGCVENYEKILVGKWRQ